MKRNLPKNFDINHWTIIGYVFYTLLYTVFLYVEKLIYRNMKHIKTFEEIDFIRSFYQSEKSEFLELKDFCESNLIYLMDDQFRVDLFESENGGYTIHLIKDNDETWFSWQQISDYYISFVNRLLNEFKFF